MIIAPDDNSRHARLARHGRWLFAALGCLFVGIGAVGVVVPLLPTTPFMLLAAACFARGSRRLHGWLLNTRLFGPTIRAWQETRSIPLHAKVMAITLMAVVLGTSILLLIEPPLLQVGLGLVGLGVIVWLIWLPTRGAEGGLPITATEPQPD